MDAFQQKEVLDSFRVLVDRREQPTDRARRRYASFGSPYEMATISYGDYAGNAILPGGKSIYDTSNTVEPLCVVERKMNLDELAGCFTKDRARFRREFERAQEQGAQIFLIVENATWENLINGKYRSRFHPAAFLGSIIAWSVRYNLKLLFCKEETSGKLIKEILFRDLKERVERGDYG
jgi:ERCC4-type nuclease